VKQLEELKSITHVLVVDFSVLNFLVGSGGMEFYGVELTRLFLLYVELIPMADKLTEEVVVNNLILDIESLIHELDHSFRNFVLEISLFQ